MWEHAYHAQYGPDSDRWVDNVMSLVNWDFVANRYAAARASRRMAG